MQSNFCGVTASTQMDPMHFDSIVHRFQPPLVITIRPVEVHELGVRDLWRQIVWGGCKGLHDQRGQSRHAGMLGHLAGRIGPVQADRCKGCSDE